MGGARVRARAPPSRRRWRGSQGIPWAEALPAGHTGVMAIATVNPATGETVKVFDAHTPEQVEAALARADATYKEWRRRSFAERATLMRRAADLLDADNQSIAEIMTLEMGKTLAAAKGEASKCAMGMRFYADHAETFLADEPLADPSSVKASKAYTRWQPIGPVLAVMPWNFPMWQVVRFAAPALMAGNVGLLKHASERSADRALSREPVRPRRLPRGRVPDPAHPGPRRGEGPARPAREGRDAHRLRARRTVGRRDRRRRDQAHGARARRLRPVRRHAVCRHRPGSRGRRHGTRPEQRPVVHRGQAVHRARGRLRGVHRALRLPDGRPRRR